MTAAPTIDFAAARRAMIDSQLRTSGVNEPWVLARMNAVAREDFVPGAARSAAYIDRAVPLGDGAMLPAPLVHARMLAEARPTPEDRVLVVDGGIGYLPALLEGLAGSVSTISADDAVKGGKKGDFTLLMIDGAIEALPDGLAKRLADDARVVTGLVEGGVTRLAIGRKAAGRVALLPLTEIGIPRLSAFDTAKAWSF
ncbi:Protein-L-isoaspartate O-methyltransferase [Tsuneonella dongtanensis]|uniref:Protein-L-isoaspartate O-methyltransferase n=1 Tax=Tsuneonella dongtanensis TaxID=692370 RepID=A0A1B2AAG1_9SPHN|nr:protein-L-isoaspartate O-methyltransferase [Tsuneonella dongtanensis]ANY19035.1 Protein-L-isoaspartate O-methyltransferase [Tsuneonella dongtanensis]